MSAVRLVVAGSAAFGLALGGLALVDSRPAGSAPAAAPARDPETPALPAGGRLVASRPVVFNGVESRVRIYRFERAPEEVLAGLTSLLTASGLSGREVGRAVSLDPAERAAWEAGRFFTVESLGDARRVAWRRDSELLEVCLRPEAGGTTGIWSAREAAAWVPDGGDCPGRDPEGFVRPAGWTRAFCVDTGASLLLCFTAPGAPAEAARVGGAALEAGGWAPDPGNARGIAAAAGSPAAVHVRGSRRALTTAFAGREGTQVSVMITARSGSQEAP